MLKVILSVLMFGVMAQASDCPNLTGKFMKSADENDGVEVSVDINQTETAGVTTYTLSVLIKYGQQEFTDVSSFIADGVTRTSEEPDDGGVYKYSDAYTCADGVLKNTYSGSYTDKSGKELEKMEGTGLFKIDTNNNLEYADTYTDESGKVTQTVDVYTRQ